VTLAFQPGPQRRAAESRANIIVFGGEAGGGKSRFIVQHFANLALLYEGFQAVIFRRTSPELHGAGSLWEEAQEVFRAIPGFTARESPVREWRLDRSLIEFRHLQYEQDKYAHQGKQYAGIAFDEATHFTESQFWYLQSRNRNAPAGLEPFTILTVNPDPDSFVKKLIAWWLDSEGKYPIPERDGVLRWFVRVGDELVWSDRPDQLPHSPDAPPRSLTFIRSRLSDNKILLQKDPGYKARLQTLLPHEYARLGKGDWSARPSQGDFFQRGWFRELAPDSITRRLKRQPDLGRDLVKCVRCWDLAATPVKGCLVPGVSRPPDFVATTKDGDWSRGVKLGVFRNRDMIVLDMVSCRDTPGAVDELIRATAISDGPGCIIGLPQDPGQAGIDQLDRKKRDLKGLGRVIGQLRSRDKEFYARPAAVYAYNRRIWYLRGEWTNDFFNEIEVFPPQESSQHDDVVDAFADCFRLADTLPMVYDYEAVKDFFRNEAYDRETGQWDCEDPISEDRIRVNVGFRRGGLL